MVCIDDLILKHLYEACEVGVATRGIMCSFKFETKMFENDTTIMYISGPKKNWIFDNGIESDRNARVSNDMLEVFVKEGCVTILFLRCAIGKFPIVNRRTDICLADPDSIEIAIKTIFDIIDKIQPHVPL